MDAKKIGWIGRRSSSVQLARASDSPLGSLDIAWLSGLIEGEGCIHSSDMRRGSTVPHLILSMTDLDIVERVAALWDTRISSVKRSDGGKEVHTTQVVGHLAAQWLMTLYSSLGSRRREKTRTVLARWRSSPRALVRRNTCHPELPHGSFGLCKRCYKLQWRAARRAERVS